MMKKHSSGKVFWKILACVLFLMFISGSMLSFRSVSTFASQEDNTVHVSNVDEFLAAIAPNTRIILAPGGYNLTMAKMYGRGGSEYYHWESVFDGYELVITDTQNLTIQGEDWYTVTICTEPRYANVLRFENCTNTEVSTLTAGHTIEPGSCAGGVLRYEYCDGIEVNNARLYGCGILGLSVWQCTGVHLNNSDIYECSEGAVSISRCREVLLENSKFYSCSAYSGIISVEGSSNVGIINSEFFDNIAEYASIFATRSPGIYLGGLDIHDNCVYSVIESYGSPVTLEKSRIQQSGIYSGECPVDTDGKPLTDYELMNMGMRYVTWSPITTEPVYVEPAEDGKYHVHTVDEFLSAIGPDRVIYLEPGVYDLSQAADYGGMGTMYYYWETTYDGMELRITGVRNLTIEGAGTDKVTIAAVPRYANVLCFESCTGIELHGFTAGHTQKPGECAGGVLYFFYSDDVVIEDCSLYGCGILGVWAESCLNMKITETEIYECSDGAAKFFDCRDVLLEDCNIHDNGGIDFYAGYGSSNVIINGENYGDKMYEDWEPEC